MSNEGYASRASREVLLVGLGAVAETHVKALEEIPGVVITAGVDKAFARVVSFRGSSVPIYKTIEGAACHHNPDLVIVATPTSTHAAVCAEVVSVFPTAEVLVEKPASDNLPDAVRMLVDFATRTTINVAYHMAFSPEVIWAQRIFQEKVGVHGAPLAIQALFSDPYESQVESAKTRYCSSWIDSGINAVSVIQRFCHIITRRSLRSLGPDSWSAFEGRFLCQFDTNEFEALVLTSWHVSDPGRTTRIKFRSGAELIMDHHAVAGYWIGSKGVEECFGSNGQPPRRLAHYRNLYRTYLVDHIPMMSAQESCHLHKLVLCTDGSGADLL